MDSHKRNQVVALIEAARLNVECLMLNHDLHALPLLFSIGLFRVYSVINAFYELIQKYRTASAKKYLQVNFILILQS